MMGWRPRWERSVAKTQHTNTHLVFALQAPKIWAPRLRDPRPREISPITIEEYRPVPQHKNAFRPSEASDADVDEDGYRTISSKRTGMSHLDAMRIPPGGNWSDHDAEDLDELESLNSEEEDITEEL